MCPIAFVLSCSILTSFPPLPVAPAELERKGIPPARRLRLAAASTEALSVSTVKPRPSGRGYKV